MWKEVLNSDAALYGGSGMGNLGSVRTRPHPSHGDPLSMKMTLPPLAVVFLKWLNEREAEP